MRLVPLMVSASVTAMLATLPAWAADGEIRSVLLSSGGLAEVVRTFDADGPAAIRLSVPVEQVDDVLKSIVVSDPTGTVTGVSLEGADTVTEAFRTLPFGPADLVSTERIATAMRGFEAIVDDGEGNSARGVILGVTEVQRPSEGGSFTVPAVALQGADGRVRQVLLGPAASIEFADPMIAARIAEAGRGLRGGKDAAAKSVVVTTEGAGRREVSITHVAAAPVWKVTYRAIAGDDGRARIQGWAILENASGEDWNGVRVTLSSSSPVALRQRLYDLYWRERQEAPIALPGGPARVRADDGSLARMREESEDFSQLKMEQPAAPSLARGQAMEMMDMVGAPAASPVPSRPTQAMTAVEGDIGIRFTIPEPVDLASGHTLSVPIIDADYEAELVSLWQPANGSRHPIASLFVTNDAEASLPPGIFTIFDDEGYLGDAQILGIPPGEVRYAGFAVDPKVTVESTVGQDSGIASVRASRGVVTISRRTQRTTTYTVEGAVTAPRTVLIDHPRQVGWRATADATVVSESGSDMRLRTVLPAAGEAVVTVTESLLGDEALYLMDAEINTLMAWASAEGIDDETAEKFEQLAEIRQRVSDAEDEVALVSEEINRIANEQARIRDNLRAVPATSDLAKSYLDALARHEQMLADATARRDSAEAAARTLRTEYEAAILAF